eukprot:TRINITY_DN2746_c0_g1_i17.p1 TRINITY_DN2746_c0_g1~~TRINITY_DN2746_c0_g1_i17.p1  ORF type:complete len:427 (-),score=111.47 TRINITY_DN2746_c0_g1_i17:83-1192(-)
MSTSIDIQPSWGDPLLNIEWSSLRESLCPVPTVSNLSSHGLLEEYNTAYDNVSVNRTQPLERHWAIDRKLYQVTTSDDPILQGLMTRKVGQVFATDSILAVLMTSLNSVYSWDLMVTRKGDQLVFDKRDMSFFDFMDVNENSNEPPTDEPEISVNSVDSLSKEATALNINFFQQILSKSESQTFKFPQPNPFQSGDDRLASTAYLYRVWDFGEDDVKLVARTEVNGYKMVGGKLQTLFIRALNEYDPKITGGWKKKLENQKAGAFATELQNNNCKLNKWLAQAHLSGAKEIKLGYVSRVTPKDPLAHTILDITEYATDDFANEIAMDYQVLWGSLKYIIDVLMDLEEGKYCLLRDPTKRYLTLYKLGGV